jgi:hypothetical protein
MIIPLSEEEQEAIDAAGQDPPRLIDPRSQAEYVLIPSKDYETIREILEDEARQRIIRRIGLKNAPGRMDEEP